MPEQTRRDDKSPTRSPNMDPAEGSREAADANAAADAGGITNRPLEEEQDNQQRVPPRGQSKEGARAAEDDQKRTKADAPRSGE